MEYDSDSELRATDTLRLDSDSEEEVLSPQFPARETIADRNNHPVSTVDDARERSVATPDLAEENRKASDNEGRQSFGAPKQRPKVSKIIDSGSEDEPAPETAVPVEDGPTEGDSRNANLQRLKTLLDSDSDASEQVLEKQIDSTKKIKKKKSKILPRASEKDVATDDEQTTGEDRGTAKSKRKKRPPKKREVSPATTAKDMLAGLNLFFDDEDDETHKSHEPSYGPVFNGHSEDDSDIGEGRTRNKPVQKMTEKQALEERQIIQSESQRMAREAYIDVPYHRTKAYSFEEFLARKTIRKADPERDCVGRQSDISIKMTPEQLVMFERQLKERELESQEFFKSESESSDEETKKDDLSAPQVSEDIEPPGDTAIETNTEGAVESEAQEQTAPLDPVVVENDSLGNISAASVADRTDDPIDDIVNRTSENMEHLISTVLEPEPSSKCARPAEDDIKYDLITPSQSDTISTRKASLIAKLNLPPCPRLSGHSDMLIDLDSGTLEPKEPSGADILFHRLAKCSGSGQRKSAPANSKLTILSTEDGVVKLNTISLLTDEERPLVQKEPIPGAAYLKLKQVLKEKIDNDRRTAMQKREQEYAKKMELEKEEMGDETDEDVEELLDEEECADDDVEGDEKSHVAGRQKDLLDDEAMDDDRDDDDEGSVSGSSSDDNNECDDEGEETAAKRKGRIIKAFEDSDDENAADTLQAIRTSGLGAIVQEGLTQSDDMKLSHTVSSRGNEDEHENFTLPWSKDDSPEDDLMELCSGRFATQLPPEGGTPIPTGAGIGISKNSDAAEMPSTSKQKPLYTQADGYIGDSQLMDLCSGRFETQLPAAVEGATQLDTADENPVRAHDPAVSDSSDILTGGKLCLDSSEDEADREEKVVAKKTKKRKRKLMHLSDDEDETADQPNPATDSGGEESEADELGENEKIAAEGVEANEEDEGEEVERYVDYDSEENEVEVKLSKKAKKQIVANFVENEAELSESEWGSADEDEKDLDRYDVEVGDEEQFDQRQLQQELEKIHNRQMLDQDNREVEQLKEFFFEDEENDGVGRVRQFRWKNVEKTFTLDYDKQKEGDNDAEGVQAGGGEASDEEAEQEWRKMRHERNKLLKEQNMVLTETELVASTLLNPEDTIIGPTVAQENIQSVGNVSAVVKKKITIVKKTTTANTGREDSPFLISKSSVLQGHKASFLSRDAETLNKLANLVKTNPDDEGISTVTAAKARNFVFTALSPALEKQTSKRSLDPEDAEEKTNIKKVKTGAKESTSKKKLLLGSLM